MKRKFQPTPDAIKEWIKAYVPDKDLFFLPENNLASFKEYLSNVLVVPHEEFKNHSTYKQIQLANSYEYWNLSKEVKYVLVTPPGWVNHLPVEKKDDLFHIQVEVGRGLIHPISDFTGDASFLHNNVVEVNGEKYLVLHKAMWEDPYYTSKEEIITDIAQQWEDWTCYHVPPQTPQHLLPFANTFPSRAGSNCLSATLFAITKQEWIIHEWVHPQTFLQSLKNEDYHLIFPEDMRAGDVLTWENADGIIQHASYCIDGQFFFNKRGQTFFNAWSILHYDDLKEDWGLYHMKCFRKQS
ncbi:hypothetical protein [Rossellomorea vietnamensis]|uniref:Uncharacterized protein n=1 Tax=Rossellomorea vietnamensis TaxID=218284 RepID=A0A0P6W7M0_9BACI|nr:hypothetical protein [Rossellomorea vietnamensis]KPL60999.1 hypothetical protein AM506_04550 [Rossellomorea vietnamensis]